MLISTNGVVSELSGTTRASTSILSCLLLLPSGYLHVCVFCFLYLAPLAMCALKLEQMESSHGAVILEVIPQQRRLGRPYVDSLEGKNTVTLLHSTVLYKRLSLAPTLSVILGNNKVDPLLVAAISG